MTKKQWEIKRGQSKLQFKFGDWDKYWDCENECEYYFNRVTEEWQYEKPDDYVEDVELDNH